MGECRHSTTTGPVINSGLKGMSEPGTSESFQRYIAECWRLRFFTTNYALGRVRASRADMWLGSLWLVLEPAIAVTTYYVVFELILGRGAGIENFISFLAVGQMLFANGRKSIQRTATSLTRNEQLVESFTFPHLVFPLADLLDAAVSLCYTLVVVLALLMATGESPALAWLLILPIALSQLLIGLGIGLLLGRIMSRATDLVVVMENVFRALLFLSGVFWSVDKIATGANRELLLKLLSVNPIYCAIQLGRWSLLGTRPEPLRWILGSMFLWIVVSMVLGMWRFYVGEQHHSGSFRVKRDR